MRYCPFRAIDANTQGDVCFADLPWAVEFRPFGPLKVFNLTCLPFGSPRFGYGSFLGGKNFGASGLIAIGVRTILSRTTWFRVSFSLKPGAVWQAGCRSHPAPMRTEAAASDGRRIFVTR